MFINVMLNFVEKTRHICKKCNAKNNKKHFICWSTTCKLEKCGCASKNSHSLFCFVNILSDVTGELPDIFDDFC